MRKSNSSFTHSQISDVYHIDAEVVTRVAGSLGAGGLPGYPEVLFDEINVMKSSIG